MSEPINPNALRYFRHKRKLNQDELAGLIKCTKSTISRWERGQSRSVRKLYQDRLSDVLRCQWLDLTREPAIENERQNEIFPKVQFNTRIEPLQKNAFTVVSKLYGVSYEEIVELAPLLFFLVAEKSLERRRNGIDQAAGLRAQYEECCDAKLSHAHPSMFGLSYDWDEFVSEEQAAIRKRDVFGRISTYDVDKHDPLVNFIQDEIEATNVDLKLEIHPNWRKGPDYYFPDSIIAEIVDLDLGNDKHADAVRSLRLGMADLRSAISKRQDLDEEHFLTWIKERVDDWHEVHGLDALVERLGL